MPSTTSIDELATRVGTELGVSDYVKVSQSMVDVFANVTGDHQWIHTDRIRAKASPFGGTIAHGYLTLALAPMLLEQVLPLGGYSLALNCGLDKLRFLTPLPVGDRVRMRVGLDAVETIAAGAKLSLTLTFERRGAAKPVCVATALYRVYE